jgi:hypothetical protein
MIKNQSLPKVLLFLIICLANQSIQAQKYSVGVRAGVSYTWPGFGDKEAKDEFNRGFKPGYHGGIFISFPLKNKYDLFLEGGASRKGRVMTIEENGWKNNLTLGMVDMSMLLRKSFTFMLKKNTPADAFVNIGPEINYWFQAKGKLVVQGVDYPYDIEYDVAIEDRNDYNKLYVENVNRWLFGIGIGFGLKAPLGRNKHLTTELRFNSGHTFLGKKESPDRKLLIGYNDTFKTNLKTISISFAYSIDLDVIERRKGKSTINKKLKR